MDQQNPMSSALWTLDELHSISAAYLAGHSPDAKQQAQAINGIQIDSRRVTAGDLFVPLRAPWAERDGHQFIHNAIARGASAYLCADESYRSGQSIYVQDTFKGLNALARLAVKRSKNATRIALTGSSGKTTLRHWLGQMLSNQGR
ncbi:MAG: Mur ligase domain-containing protein, partial [Pseudomonadales bacterium]